MLNFELIDMASFWNVWFWIMMIVAWSMTAHWTIGVPFDIIMAANRHGGLVEEHCDTLTYINAGRLIYYFDKGGPYFLAFIGFFLGMLGALGFYSGYEFAQALFILLGPLVIPNAFNLRLAYKIEAQQPHGQELRNMLRRRRLWNQIIGFGAITIAMVIAVINLISRPLTI